VAGVQGVFAGLQALEQNGVHSPCMQDVHRLAMMGHTMHP